MKKFIYNLFLYCLIICPVLVALDGIYIYQNRKRDESTKFLSVPENIEICNLGSSHGKRSFNYEDIEGAYTCFNFGLDSQSLSYDLRVLKNYIGNLKEGAAVFITVSYFSFYGKDETLKEDFVSRNRRYYKFLPKELIKDYETKTDIIVNYAPALFDHANFIPVILGNAQKDSNIWLSEITSDEAMADAKIAASRHLITYGGNENGVRIRNQKEIQSLYEIIELCKDNGVKAILITTPYLSEYSEEVLKIAPDFYDDFYGIIEKVVKNTGIEYFDYATDTRFTDEYSLFINSDHLNKKGARKFTDIVISEALGISY